MSTKQLIQTLIFLLLCIAALCLSVPVKGAELGSYAFPFIGKWNCAENPALLDEYGLQDIQNLRKDGKHFKGVSGHTVVNTSSTSTTPYILNGFHFRKDQPQESHIFIYAADTSPPTNATIWSNTTAVPSAGDFSTTAFYVNTDTTNIGRFSYAPAGNMIYANGNVTYIWSGNEMEATSVVTSAQTVTYTLDNPNDYSSILNNARQSADQTATLVSSGGVDSYTKLMLHFNGADGSNDFVDNAVYRTVTVAGNAQLDTAQKKFGTASGLFDGTGDDITVPDHEDFNFGYGDFTIDFWVKFNSTAGTQSLYSHWSNTTTYVNLFHSAADGWQFRVFHTSVAWVSFGESGSPVADADWHHVALVRSGDLYTIYEDGVAVASQTVAGYIPDYGGTPRIGSLAHSYEYFNGWVDEYRISKGIARYGSTFTVPTDEYGSTSGCFLVGFKRPLQGVKPYIVTGNVTTSTMSAWEWGGSTWNALSITDGTASGGATLAQTGAITWTATGNAQPRYLNGLSLYWYQFYFDAGQATLYYLTVDSPVGPIRNIWDGTMKVPAKVLKYDGTTYTDYTNESIDDSDSTYATLSSFANTHALYLGFLEPQQAIELKLVAAQYNSNASVMTLACWNGSEWRNVTSLNDGTAESGVTLSKGGVITFQGATKGQEWRRAINDEYPLYYYRITVSATLDASVQVAQITGAPYPDAMGAYEFGATFQNRLFLFNESGGAKNRAIYSVANAPDIFNGTDSGELIFGDRTSITAAAVAYNVFNTTGIEQLIVTKKNETYRLSGDGPDNWEVQKISGNVGCVAPLSMVSAETTETAKGTKRQVAIWQSDKGFVMSDGAAVVPISDEIKPYFDPNDSRYIPTDRQAKTIAWYDPGLKSYKALISSGAGQTYHNVELEYSLATNEWTKIYRTNAAGANPLQSGWQVFDTNGLSYTYGGGKDGTVYRLENGNDWNGTSIASYLWTKDLLLDQQLPFLRKTSVKYLRTAYKQKATGNVTITHYGDGTASVTGTSGQVAPSVITDASSTRYNTQSVMLGPALHHSFRYSASTSVADGLELTGMGIYFEPYTAVR
jgi:hypothetical protein